MQSKPSSRCTFCGSETDDMTKEHVVSRCLYDGRLANPQLQMLTVPSCRKCNNSWSKDETAMRNAFVLTNYTSVTQALFPAVIRSITTARYAERENQRLKNLLRVLPTHEGPRLVVYPGGKVGGTGEGPKADPGILRVVRKVARGYSYEKGFSWPVPDSRVIAVLCPNGFPEDVLAGCHYEHRDPTVFECWWSAKADGDDEFESYWFFRFYQKVHFFAAIVRHDLPKQFDHRLPHRNLVPSDWPGTRRGGPKRVA